MNYIRLKQTIINLDNKSYLIGRTGKRTGNMSFIRPGTKGTIIGIEDGLAPLVHIKWEKSSNIFYYNMTDIDKIITLDPI